jgi:NhaP-type Na+/H+ or K+/H+ antiporter
VTTDQILFGIGLTVVLAVGSQLLASRLRIPALIVLLPVGFTAGALTDDINPNRLLGPAFQPLVSLSVALILYDAAVGLDLKRLKGHTRRTVVRLIVVGVPLTWTVATLVAIPLFGMSTDAALMLGVILVVSGPTVVGPLLNFVRPVDRLQRVLSWEGSLIDPIGGILGAVTFHAVSAQSGGRHPFAHFAVSVGTGLLGGVVGAGLLWLLLHTLHLGETLSTLAQLASVIGIAAACDIVRDDSGLIAAIIMGLVVANLPGYKMSARRRFFETLIQLMLGLLFISISATVAPPPVRHVMLPTLALVAVLVLVTRPLVAYLSSLRTDLSRGERMFIAWMAPRGIVAAATASTFGPALAARGVDGASKILPATFLVIVATVALYGLTAIPVAKRLGVTRPTRTKPLLVGDDPWVLELAKALKSMDLEVLMWAGSHEQRAHIAHAGLALAPGRLIDDVTDPGAQFEGVTTVLLLTSDDDFNALATAMFTGRSEASVYRLGAASNRHSVIGTDNGQILFSADMTSGALAAHHRAGAHVVAEPAGPATTAGRELLFLVHPDGRLAPITRAGTPPQEDGDIAVAMVLSTLPERSHR